MSYIGNNLQVAFPSYTNIDDISGSFNGSTTSFALTVNGAAPVPLPINSQQCLISVNGVIQRPDDTGTEGFRLSGGNIIFSSAPSSGWDFFGIILAGADYVNVGVKYPVGSLAAPSITFDSDLDTGFYSYGANQIGVSCGGVLSVVFTSTGYGFGAGTAAAPGLFVTGDTNTGFYSPGADQIGIATGGTGRLTIDASGNATFGSNVTLNAQGDLRFADADSSNWVAFQAPSTVASNVTWTLPSADGSANQVLTTNGSGTLTWSTPSGGIGRAEAYFFSGF